MSSINSSEIPNVIEVPVKDGRLADARTRTRGGVLMPRVRLWKNRFLCLHTGCVGPDCARRH